MQQGNLFPEDEEWLPPPPPPIVAKPKVYVVKPEDYPYYPDYSDAFPYSARAIPGRIEIDGYAYGKGARPKRKHFTFCTTTLVLQGGGQGLKQFLTPKPANHATIDARIWDKWHHKAHFLEWVDHALFEHTYCIPMERALKLGKYNLTPLGIKHKSETGEIVYHFCIPFAAFDTRLPDGTYKPHTLE